jgi:hypothetical protein
MLRSAQERHALCAEACARVSENTKNLQNGALARGSGVVGPSGRALVAALGPGGRPEVHSAAARSAEGSLEIPVPRTDRRGLDRHQNSRGNDTAGEHWHVARPAQCSREGSPKPKKEKSHDRSVRERSLEGQALWALWAGARCGRRALAAVQKSTSATARPAEHSLERRMSRANANSATFRRCSDQAAFQTRIVVQQTADGSHD